MNLVFGPGISISVCLGTDLRGGLFIGKIYGDDTVCHHERLAVLRSRCRLVNYLLGRPKVHYIDPVHF
jgi:hypothetical protein